MHNYNSNMPQQLTHSRIQQLFIPRDNGALSYFYASNKIISNPSVLWEIFQNFQDLGTYEQEKVVTELSSILESVSTNSYILNKQMQMQSVMELVVQLIPNYVKNYLIFGKLLLIFQKLAIFCSNDQLVIDRVIKKLVNEYVSEEKQVEQSSLFAAISILKSFFNVKIDFDREPAKMMAFHGDNGLQIRHIKKQINWFFSNGMSIYFWLNIQNIKYGNQAPLPKLFTFFSPNHGGFECYLIDNKIYYRTLGSKYNSPKIGSNGIFLGEIQPKKWTFIGIEHQPSKRLTRSQLILRLNNTKTSYNLSPPSISSKQMMQMVFFDKVYCKTSSICLIPAFVQDDLALDLCKHKNSIDMVKHPKALIFEPRQGNLYQRNQLGFCPDLILNRSSKINFQVIVPLFHLYRFVTLKEQPSYPILNELLSLFVLFLYKSPQNQIEAARKNYPHLMAQLIKSLPNSSQRFTDETINSLLHIKQNITNTDLLAQYHSDLLWGLIDSDISIQSKQMLLQIIKNNFTQNVSYFSNIIGLDQMINALLSINNRTNRCCEKHYKIMLTRFQKDILEDEIVNFGENEQALQYILKIIQLYVQNQKVNSAQQIYKLCRVLCVKFSPCFTLSFMSTLKRVMVQKLNQKVNSNQPKMILQYLVKKKTHLIFLHVLENSFFAEIKSESARIIYTILLKKSSPADQEQVSYQVSKFLWKINQFTQENQKLGSNSPKKSNHSIENSPREKSVENEIVLTKKSSFKSGRTLKIKSMTSSDSDASQKNKAKAQEEVYRQVGPQAPQLSNRTKGKKSFSFNFMSEQTQSFADKAKGKRKPGELRFPQSTQSIRPKQEDGEIMEEQKTNQNDMTWTQTPYEYEQKKQQQEEQVKPKMKNKKFGLSINTDEINKMYNDQGQQIVATDQQKQVQFNKIVKLAKICVAAMKGIKYQEQKQTKVEAPTKKFVVPPSTTSNKVLKGRNLKLSQLKLIDEENQMQSAQKPEKQQMSYEKQQVLSPNFGSKKSKSPTSMNSLNEQGLTLLYLSLMQNCVSSNFDLITPSILYIFFNWIPQTNLQLKFLTDLMQILENQPKGEKVRTIVKMPQLYDFLFQLSYKALLFEQMQQKRPYVDKMEQVIKKVFAFIFRQDPESIGKFSFILQWANSKAKQYHPKCLFLTTRYIMFLIMDTIQQDLLSGSRNDKLMQRNFQELGFIIGRFCRFLPNCTDPWINVGVSTDQYERIIFLDQFQLPPTMVPYFTNIWADSLICEKYYILFRKFFCTDWYAKNLKYFELYLQTGNIAPLEQLITNSLNAQSLQLQAESQYYTKYSLIFPLIQVNTLLLIQKLLQNEKDCIQKAQLIWQTIAIALFAESSKQKNTKLNSEISNAILKNCKFFCTSHLQKAAVFIPLMKHIRLLSSQIVMSNSGLIQQNSSKLQSASKNSLFAQFFIESYINQKLFQDSNSEMDFENFQINFKQVWISGQSHDSKIKSQFFSKFSHKVKQNEGKILNLIEQLSILMEQQTQRYNNTEVLVKSFHRQARNAFRKLWKQLFVMGGPWTPPGMTLQNDNLYSKSLFTYQRQQQNQFYKWRICKHMSKYRLRYFLKPVLHSDLQYCSVKNNQFLPQKLQIGLNKAVMYYYQNKLMLGMRIISWLLPKVNYGSYNIFNFSATKQLLDIVMPFKKVRLIKTLTVRHGYLAIINDKLVFLNCYYREPATHLSIAEYQLKRDKTFYKLWQVDLIKQIFKRRYVNRKRAVQVMFINGKSAMFQFYENDHEDFIKKILKFKGNKCPNLVTSGSKSLDAKKQYDSMGLFKKWSQYEISNFQYLMQLNNLAGRSYCDLTQYPVMPWILCKFDGVKFSLSDQSSYRNLSLPMGAMGNQKRVQGFRQRFDNMSEIQDQKFHYGTHYSSPAIVYHFLVRLSPFTQGSILLQSGKFDFADRLFFSIADSFKNATSQYSDVRELIPELYTFPEAYLNLNKLDMGVMQNQNRVHNVLLPPWAKQNPYGFVARNRKAFQDFTVSKSLAKWIDLIFGYKQRGVEAEKNLNCFVHMTYEDSINFQQIKDEKNVKAIQTQIINFGQTPSQLFNKAHSDRVSPASLQIPNTICDPGVQPRIYRPSRHNGSNLIQNVQKDKFNAMRQSPQSIVHMRWFKQSRLVFIRKNGEMLFYKWAQPNAGSKVPFQCAIEKQKTISRVSKNSPQNIQYFDPSLKVDSFPVQFLNSGHALALGGIAQGKLLMIDVDVNAVIDTYISHTATICCIKSDLKDNFLITGDISGHVIIWKISNGSKLTIFNQMHDHSKQITSFFICYDLRCLFTSSLDGTIICYNIITNRKIKVFNHPKYLPINHVVVSTSPLPIVIMFSNQQNLIYCYSINGQLIYRVHEKDMSKFLSPAVIKDTLGFEHLVYGNEQGHTVFRDLPFMQLEGDHVVAKQAAVNCVCVSKSARFVIVGCSDGELSVIAAPLAG